MYLYRSFISKIEKCPATDYSNRNIGKCFRWIYSDISDLRNFEPPAVRSNRVNHWIHVKSCGKFASSFHIDLEGSIAHYKKLCNQFGLHKASEWFGTHIAQGSIAVSDGVCNDPCSQFSHFDIHLYVEHTLHLNFTLIDKLIADEV